MKFYNFNEDLKIVYLGDYFDITEADSDNDDFFQIAIIGEETLNDWKEDFKVMDTIEKSDDFIFVLTQDLTFKIVDSFPSEDSYDEALDDFYNKYVFSGKEGYNIIKQEIHNALNEND